MIEIIEQLKEQRQKAKDIFIENSLIKRASVVNSPLPDTESYLEEIYSLNKAISILENHDTNHDTNHCADFLQQQSERMEKRVVEHIRGAS
jgi:hypothetical protein